MAKQKATHSSKKQHDLRYFERLRSYMAKMAVGRLRKHQLFSLCIRASLCKCFEFNLAVRQKEGSEIAFFAIPSLRGICEDLIVLNYIRKIRPNDRDVLIANLMAHDVHTRIKQQDIFFTIVRPQQPVLRIKAVDRQLASIESTIQKIWNQYGWPHLKHGVLPQIRQIAEKQSLSHLTILYDYLYRLTSAGVHFNVQSLLRTGWGPDSKIVRFSTDHFRQYFAAYCTTYGAFMFCVYFEFFGAFLRPSAEVTGIVAKIRENLLYTSRWPEMVTFEEMNMKPPKNGEVIRMIVSAAQAVLRKRLISEDVNYTNIKSAERRDVRDLLKTLTSSTSRKNQDK